LEEISKKLDATSSKVDETNRRMEGMLSPIDDIKVRIRGGEAMEAQI
jgi:peptidoglycan hydrolase CwlO-like protein